MNALVDWLDNRTGIKQALASVFYQRIPGGASWRYVWGTVLLFAVVVQFITGIVLWMHYSPSTQTAWESVYYIQHQMDGGSLLRGIHLYTSSALMILMPLHLLQIVVHGAYRRPREFTYWFGLGAMIALLGLGQTGYLLTWDQRGFGAAKVATSIAGSAPVIGDDAKAIALGGDDLGHHTLTRFAALHMGVLPGMLVLFLVLHAAMGRRNGLTPPAGHDETLPAKKDGLYWPDQALRDGLVSLAVIGTIIWITVNYPAELGPPADATVAFNTARPEWYFRFLFQLLKYFHGASGIFIASQVIPGTIMLVLFLMPFIGRWRLGRHFNVVFLLSVFAGIIALTGISFYEDYNGKTKHSQDYLADLRLAHAEAERSIELASLGIPVDGSQGQTRRDPLIAGRRLFKQHCASCHSHYDPSLENPAEQGDALTTVVCDEPTAANLYKFGSRQWMEGILDHEKFASEQYFGKTLFAEGDMFYWVQGTIGDELADMEDDEKEAFKKQVKAAAWAISGLAELPYQKEEDQRDKAQLEAGMDVVLNELSCIDCHTLGDEEAGAGPILTGYASEKWLADFIRNPQTEEFFYNEDNYDEADRLMPGYATHTDNPDLNTLSDEQVLLIARWIRHDWPKAEVVEPAAEKADAGEEPADEPAAE